MVITFAGWGGSCGVRTCPAAEAWPPEAPPHAPVMVETLDVEHGNAVTAWQAMGRPASPTRAQIGQLKQAGLATRQETLKADEQGNFSLKRMLAPGAWC